MAVSLKNSPDFNRPVTLQVGAEAPGPSALALIETCFKRSTRPVIRSGPHKSVMEMDQFFKRRIAHVTCFSARVRYYGEPAQSPHSSKFKPDPKVGSEGARVLVLARRGISTPWSGVLRGASKGRVQVVKVPDNESKKKAWDT